MQPSSWCSLRLGAAVFQTVSDTQQNIPMLEALFVACQEALFFDAQGDKIYTRYYSANFKINFRRYSADDIQVDQKPTLRALLPQLASASEHLPQLDSANCANDYLLACESQGGEIADIDIQLEFESHMAHMAQLKQLAAQQQDYTTLHAYKLVEADAVAVKPESQREPAREPARYELPVFEPTKGADLTDESVAAMLAGLKETETAVAALEETWRKHAERDEYTVQFEKWKSEGKANGRRTSMEVMDALTTMMQNERQSDVDVEFLNDHSTLAAKKSAPCIAVAEFAMVQQTASLSHVAAAGKQLQLDRLQVKYQVLQKLDRFAFVIPATLCEYVTKAASQGATVSHAYNTATPGGETYDNQVRSLCHINSTAPVLGRAVQLMIRDVAPFKFADLILAGYIVYASQLNTTTTTASTTLMFPSLMWGVWFELGALSAISPSCTGVNWYLIIMVVGLRFYLTDFQLKSQLFLCCLVIFWLCGFSSSMLNGYHKLACSSTFAGSDSTQTIVGRCISLSDCAPLGGVALQMVWCQLAYCLPNMDSSLPQVCSSLSSFQEALYATSISRQLYSASSDELDTESKFDVQSVYKQSLHLQWSASSDELDTESKCDVRSVYKHSLHLQRSASSDELDIESKFDVRGKLDIESKFDVRSLQIDSISAPQGGDVHRQHHSRDISARI